MRDDREELTYGQMGEALRRIRGALHWHGVGLGDVIAICGTNSVAYGLVYIAAATAGVVTAPIPQSATDESIIKMAADASAKVLFADAENAARFRRIQGLRIVQLEEIDAWAASAQPRGAVVVDEDHAFNIIYSSGTTGTPKGIVQSHAMRIAHVRLAEACGYDEQSTTLLSTPLYSNTTLVSFLPTIALGGTAIIMSKFSVEGFLQRAQTDRVTHAMLVPVQYQRLMASPRFDDFDLRSFKHKFCTSAPFSADLKRDILNRWPGGLTEYYGMTEGGGLCILFAHEHLDKLHTVGRPAPDNDIRLIDDDGGEVPSTQPGEVVGRSGSLMKGYHNRHDETEAAFWRDGEGRRFMRTGDIGRFDEDGFLILMDRKKDVIISGGFNVYPSDIEEVLLTHPHVREVAVIGAPSAKWGETPVAFVVAEGVSASDVLEFANARLGRSQRVAEVRMIDQLPRSAIGKVLKRTLREACTGTYGW
ncbi:MAG: acyl--CoA ligase [Hyphomonadaceae bacterium]|nr:acyl--CoA ligase [Hyphomonadaceae bacterium]